MIPDLTPQEIRRFYSKLHLKGCGLTWHGPLNRHGYGRFEFYRGGKRVRVLAHRLAYYLATGEDPGESKIRHACDTPACCTPDCLVPGTQAQNLRDAVERGRWNGSGLAVRHARRNAAIQERIARGEKTCSRCKVTKAMGEFFRCQKSPDGHGHECKACRAATNPRRKAA